MKSAYQQMREKVLSFHYTPTQQATKSHELGKAKVLSGQVHHGEKHKEHNAQEADK